MTTDQHGNSISQPVLILREATEAEWADSVRRDGGTPGRGPEYRWFYEVATD
jgi:hypothetical protein